MLIGQYFSKIGAKGRVALPKRFRVELGEKIILARWYENCLVAVSSRTWAKILRDFTGGEAVTRPARDTQRFLLGGSFEIELDFQGRFVIPQVLRDFARLSHEIVFAGLGDRVEIWDRKAWEEHEEKVVIRAGELAERLVRQRGQGKK